MNQLKVIKVLRELAEDEGKYLTLERARDLADKLEMQCLPASESPKHKET